MAGAKIALSGSAGELGTDGSDNAKVNLPKTIAQAGFSALASEIDPGTATGARLVRDIQADQEGRIRVGLDTTLLAESFPGAALNTTLWSQQATTMTIAVAGGFLTLNAGNSVATTVNARVQSYQYFSLGRSPLFLKVEAQFPFVPVTNNVTEWGFGIATGTAAPTDGVFFRLNAAGEFRGVVNWNGTEVQTATIAFATYVGANVSRKFVIEVTDEYVAFWIDSLRVGVVSLPAAQGSITMAMRLPVLLRTYNSAGTAQAQQLKVGLVEVMVGGNLTKPFAEQLATAGGHASQGQTGQTLGTLANYANSANPTAAVPTNTTAALGTGLGGQFWETDTLAVTTDGIISSYQNPAGTATAPGRNLHIRGVRIASFVQTVLVGGPYVANWSLAYGHTAVSLATAEGVGTKAPRRVPIGRQPVTLAQAVSTVVAGEITVDLQVPIVVYPGEFLQVVKKKVGTAPSAGVIAHLVMFDGYWE